MHSFWLPSKEFSVPATCVACGAAAAPLGQGGEEAVLTASWSTSSQAPGGGTLVRSATTTFPLCGACAGARAQARARAEARTSNYPAKWWVRALLLVGAVCLGLDVYLPPSGEVGPLVFVAVAALVAGFVLRNVMRKRFDRTHTADADEQLRLALVKEAVVLTESVVPAAGSPYSVTFANEQFAQAFHAVNPVLPSS